MSASGPPCVAPAGAAPIAPVDGLADHDIHTLTPGGVAVSAPVAAPAPQPWAAELQPIIHRLATQLFTWSCDNCADVSSYCITTDMLLYAYAVLKRKLADSSLSSDCASLDDVLGPDYDVHSLKRKIGGDASYPLPPEPAVSRAVDLVCEDCGAPSLPSHGLATYTLVECQHSSHFQDAEGLYAASRAPQSDQATLTASCVPKISPSSSAALVAIAYDARMLQHCDDSPVPSYCVLLPYARAVCPAPHPERPLRVAATVAHLFARNLYQRCLHVPSRPATDDEILLVHTSDVLAEIEELSSLGTGEVRFSPSELPRLCRFQILWISVCRWCTWMETRMETSTPVLQRVLPVAVCVK